ncbi:MAG TPA: DUF58 domain-containing protein [Candidatus Paceibacterota bacterium]
MRKKGEGMWNIQSGKPLPRDVTLALESVRKEISLGFEQSMARGRGIEFLGLREFQEGDSARDVDWMASARQPESVDLVVREFAPEHQIHVLVIADEHETMLYPKKKSACAMAILSLLGRVTFASQNILAVIGIGGPHMIHSGWLSQESDLHAFLDSADKADYRLQLRSSAHTLPELIDELKLKNTLVVFLTDLASLSSMPLESLRGIDSERSVEVYAVVLDEWSKFIPTRHSIALQNPKDGKVKICDMRRGGAIEREVQAFHERIRVLREYGGACNLSVVTVPLAEKESFQSFYKQWNRHMDEKM